jgi:predicted negative regulator of RcsB-dependent stress response
MQDYETEEQQIEAVKKWLQENGMSLFLGLALGLGAIFGGRYYLNMQKQKNASAGDLYYQVAAQVNTKHGEAAIEASDKLVTDYKSTPYASMAALLMARYEYEQSKTDEAVKQLDWVIQNAEQPELQNIARLRLARIQLADKKYDAAASLLSVKHAPAFDASFEELMGDIYVAKNEISKARAAYDKAIAASADSASDLLHLKRQDLGNVDAANPVRPPA